MRDMQDGLSLTYHPVEINPVWSGIGLSDHLLGEVQRIRWDFDRAMFNEEELDHRRHEKEWYGGVFERFERERRSVCHGRGLLSGEDDKFDLRRRSR